MHEKIARNNKMYEEISSTVMLFWTRSSWCFVIHFLWSRPSRDDKKTCGMHCLAVSTLVCGPAEQPFNDATEYKQFSAGRPQHWSSSLLPSFISPSRTGPSCSRSSRSIAGRVETEGYPSSCGRRRLICWFDLSNFPDADEFTGVPAVTRDEARRGLVCDGIASLVGQDFSLRLLKVVQVPLCSTWKICSF